MLLGKGLTQEISGDRGSGSWAPVRWIVIYPVDSTILSLNNQGQLKAFGTKLVYSLGLFIPCGKIVSPLVFLASDSSRK